MITFSDNHASLWLQDVAGGGTAINSWLNENELDPYNSLPPVFSNINDDYVGYVNGENLSFNLL